MNQVASSQSSAGFDGVSSELRERVRRSAANSAYTLITLPAKALDASRTLEGAAAPNIVWQDDDLLSVGWGQALRITAEGANRFSDIQRAAGDALNALSTLQLFDSKPVLARFYGGFAFTGEVSSDPLWSDFAPAQFTLPRFAFTRTGDTAQLTLALSRREATDEPLALEFLSRLFALRSRIELESTRRRVEEPWVPSEHVPAPTGDRNLWLERIGQILEAIARGEGHKVVLARRCDLEFDAPVDISRTLAVLRQQAKSSTLFAFREANSTFLGATPEKLISKKGLTLQADALAGSIRSGDAISGSSQVGKTQAADTLLTDRKELFEHRLVVQAIVEALAPLSARVDYEDVPHVRYLRHLSHLHTPICAELRDPRHVLQVVEALHPTPAVGGVPSAWALKWILNHEAVARGWYAAPVGWFDSAGDGEFSVALRSGIVHGHRASLYAGAGIVAGSSPASEYAETELKLAQMLGALRSGAATSAKPDGD